MEENRSLDNFYFFIYDRDAMRKWSVLILREERPVVGFVFTERGRWIFLSALIIFFSAFLYVGMEGYRQRALLSKVIYVHTKRHALLHRLRLVERKISELKDRIGSLAEFIQTGRLYVNLELLPPEEFEMGTGGRAPTPLYSDPSLNQKVWKLDEEITSISALVSFDKEKLGEVEKKIRERESLLSHTPSIWPTTGRITSSFGYRIHPVTGKREFHRGLDIANLPGTPVYATADGVVCFVGWKGGYGHTVEINHGYGYKTRYAHLRSYVVRKGQRVRRGQVIGYIGSSGLTTGPHLHYEVRVLGKPVNPYHYLDLSPTTY
ncbi:peptidase M23 [bacterium]|nr:MAG: peptidase M23 [bacterium]